MLKQIGKLTATPNKYNARSSAFNLKPQLPKGIFHHPAPASMNPEITPKAFLPKEDARLQSEEYMPEGILAQTKGDVSAPQIYQTPVPKHYKLNESDIKEIQQLRADGVSRSQIASKFGISNHFIGVISSANAETFSKHQKEVNKNIRHWGAKTQRARRIKEIKKSQWNHNG